MVRKLSSIMRRRVAGTMRAASYDPCNDKGIEFGHSAPVGRSSSSRLRKTIRLALLDLVNPVGVEGWSAVVRWQEVGHALVSQKSL